MLILKLVVQQRLNATRADGSPLVSVTGVFRESTRDAVTAFQKLPLVVPAERANTQDPTSISFRFREQLQALEADRRILTAGLATVQPWLDIPELGSAVLVTATEYGMAGPTFTNAANCHSRTRSGE